MVVTDFRNKPTVRRDVEGKGNWQDYLTEDEKEYLELCDKYGVWGAAWIFHVLK